MTKKISRRNFLKMLGIGSAVAAAGIMPLPVDMSKQDTAGDSVVIEPDTKAGQRGWVHPCADKAVPDEECKFCMYYFCPLEYETVHRWRCNQWCESLHGDEEDEA